jgi:hypothetical protein
MYVLPTPNPAPHIPNREEKEQGKDPHARRPRNSVMMEISPGTERSYAENLTRDNTG